MGDRNIICNVCGKEFTSTRSSFRRHLRLQHNLVEPVKYNVRCLQTGCIFTCPKLRELRHHLETEHKIVQKVVDMVFINIEDFKKWKTAEEQQCKTLWVKKSSGTKKQDRVTIYYYCNRSGKKQLIADNQRKRKIKKQGSCKIDSICTSAIIVNIFPHRIEVRYYRNHYGHDLSMDHMPLPEDFEKMIASQIIQGIPTSQIKSNIRQSGNIHLITKSNIHNIIRKYNLYDGNKKLDEVVSKINKSHEKAENEQYMVVIKLDDKLWRVVLGNTTHSVNIQKLEENHLCKLRCSSCSSCVHAYHCTCLDFRSNSNMCEHIHKVCLTERQLQNDDEQIYEEVLQLIIEENNGKTGDDVQNITRKNINSILIFSDRTDVKDQVVLNKVNDHLLLALNLIENKESRPRNEGEIGSTVSRQTEDQVRYQSATVTHSGMEQRVPEPTLIPLQCVTTGEIKSLSQSSPSVVSSHMLGSSVSVASTIRQNNSASKKYRPIVPRSEYPVQDMKNFTPQTGKTGATSQTLQLPFPVIAKQVNVVMRQPEEVKARSKILQKYRPIIPREAKPTMDGTRQSFRPAILRVKGRVKQV